MRQFSFMPFCILATFSALACGCGEGSLERANWRSPLRSEAANRDRDGTCTPVVLEGDIVRCAEDDAGGLNFNLNGTRWANTNVSFSFVPDGTEWDGGVPSALFAAFDALFPTAVWQREFARALATWSRYAPLNFHQVADDGLPRGTRGQVQGDSRFGDIRTGGLPLEVLGIGAYPCSTVTSCGDITLSTKKDFKIGDYVDLYSLLLHETGHALGLQHSYLNTAVMYGTIMDVYTGVSGDDIAGIQAIYGVRKPDTYDQNGGNDTFEAATVIYDNSGVAADVTTEGDSDFYRLTASFGEPATLKITATPQSLLVARVELYDADRNLMASALAPRFGEPVSLSASATAGASYWVKVAAGDQTFNIGSYELTFEGVADTAPPPVADTSAPNVTLALSKSGSGKNAKEVISGTLSDATSIKDYSIQVDGKTVTAASPGVPSSDYQYVLPLSGLAKGTHTVEVRATDPAGNVGAKQATFVK